MEVKKRNITVEAVTKGKVSIEQLVSYEQLENGVIGNIDVRNIHDSTVYISLNLKKSAEYNSYLKTLNLLQKDFDRTPESDATERLSISKQINDQKELIKTFEEDVLRIAEKISHYELQTERLKKAVDYFQQGKIREADAVLDTEEIKEDLKQIRLREEKAKTEGDSARLARKHIANEFTLKALIQETDYSDENKFEHSVASFEASLDAYEYADNCITYADFLDRHHHNSKAKSLYYKSIPYLKKEKNDEKLLNVYSKLSIIEANEKKLKESVATISKAINLIQTKKNDPEFCKSFPDLLTGLSSLKHHINEQLATSANEKLRDSLPTIQTTLVKLVGSYLQYRKTDMNSDPLLTGKILKTFAYYYLHNGEYKKSITYFERAIDFFNKAKPARHSMKEEIACMLGECYTDCHQSYSRLGKEETYLNNALVIYNDLSVANPARYLLYVAYCKRLLAWVSSDKGQKEKALKSFEESIDIYKRYAFTETTTFSYHVADIYENLSDTYKKFNEKEKSIDSLLRAIEIYQELYDSDSNAYMLKMITLLEKLIILFYGLEPADLSWDDFRNATFVFFQADYSIFNLYYILFEISNVYARNNKKELVPGVLQTLESSFLRQTKPNNYSVHIVIQTFIYHAELLSENNREESIAKYKEAINVCEKNKDKLGEDQLENFKMSISSEIGKLQLTHTTTAGRIE